MSADLAPADLRGAVVARLATDAATVEVVRALRVQNVRAILIKGAAIAERLYDDTEQRFYGDMDLLVEHRALEHAQRVLRELGFRPILGNPRVSELGPHANAWTRARPRAGVDLHTGVHFCTRYPDALWAEFTRHARQLEIGGTPVEVLGDAAQALVIVTHALAHCRQPKPLEDLGRALVRIDRAAWREAAEMAGRLGAGPAFVTGLCRTVAGARLAEELGLHYESTAEMRLALAGRRQIADGFRRLAEAGSARARIRLIAAELAPSPDALRLYSPTPFARRGRAGLVLAYLHRPLWLLFRAPRGLRIWRAASVAQPPPTARSSRALHRLGILSPANLLAAAWAWRTGTRARRQLRQGGLTALSLADPPRVALRGQRGVGAVLARRRLTCLERAAVRQRWHASHGSPRELIIGVRASGTFGAHAWLAGDPEDHSSQGHVQLLRWPARRQ